MYAGHPKTKKQVIGGSDGFDLCYYCCDDNFCNKKECEKGIGQLCIKKSFVRMCVFFAFGNF